MGYFFNFENKAKQSFAYTPKIGWIVETLFHI